MQSPDSSPRPTCPAFSDNFGNLTHECNNNSNNAVARNRWRILSDALHRSTSLETMSSSIRRFQSFGVVTALPLQNICDDRAVWYEYCANVGQDAFSILVRHPKHAFTASDLMGFNNTGNVCVWPSEEVLAYYSLCNRNLFEGKTVLELGGGMSCLAGLLIGKYSSASYVHVTDGNALSMENVQHILEKNGFLGKSNISASVLQWGKHNCIKPTHAGCSESFPSKFDIIVCADCLFFDDARHHLVETIFDLMADDGVALLTAPRRAGTLDQFYNDAVSVGFICHLEEMYNECIWERHLKLKADQTGNYDENIHYPVLLQLRKT